MNQCVHVLISPAIFFTTTKAPKFESIEDISLESLKLRPVIDEGLIFTMLQMSSQNTSFLYLRMDFQLQTHLVFQNY